MDRKTSTLKQEDEIIKTVGIIVAHPDDETLWAGGTILQHPEWRSLLPACAGRAILTALPDLIMR